MDRKECSDPARGNMNFNNNTANRNKPNLPNKPQHLTGLKNPTAPTPFSKDIVTPKGWSPKPKFSFGQTYNSADVKGRSSAGLSDARSTPKWRPVPKVTPKQGSVKESGTRRSLPAIQSVQEKQRGFGSIKRMWDERSKTPPVQHNDKNQDQDINNKSGIESYDKSLTEKDRSTDDAAVKRTTSSSSDGSVRTASFKSNKATYHYVTVNPTPAFAADALPSGLEFNETPLLPSPTKKFDHKILAPRPFQSSFDESEMIQRPISVNTKDPSKTKRTSKHSRKSRQSKKHDSSSDSDAKDATGENSEEAEMKIARKRGTLVTRFDSRGNMYKVNPRTGEIITAVDDDPKQATDKRTDKASRGVFQRMDAVSSERASVTESNSDTRERKSSESSQDIPPPLLPRERNTQRTDSSVVPPSRGKMMKSITAKPMYSGKSTYSPPSPAYFSGRLSPEAMVPPPLLPRGQLLENTFDYTPMSGTNSEIPIHDIQGSIGSSVSLNSYLDQTVYEPMNPKDDLRIDSFADEEDTFIYSAAINPPPLRPRQSIREYHEITPDIEDETSPSIVDAPPPPPEHDPPSLRGNSRVNSQGPESPPPLPPMNHRKLNYIDVEFKSQSPSNSREQTTSARTNYSEVVVGSGMNKEEGDTKKGKSVAEKLLAMISSGKAPDGYASEGDAIASSKRGEERTTDFSKERNKLKRLSGRIFRKKKQKSKQDSRDSKEYEVSQSEHGPENINVGVYGSVTNLSSSSSESSRSLSQMVSNNSGSSGDGHVRQSSQQTQRGSNVDRRQSYEPALTQLPPKLDKKSRSEAHLPCPMSLMKSNDETHSIVLPLSAEKSPRRNNKERKNSKDVSGSPAISAPRLKSHLHQRQDKSDIMPLSSRPVSEPPPMDYLAMDGTDSSKRTSLSPDIVMIPPKTLPTHRLAFDNTDDYEFADKLSPSFPTDPPPSPPGGGVRLRNVPAIQAPDPMRSIKPDRFKKRPMSHDPSYSAAKETNLTVDGAHDPIYDVVSSDADMSSGMIVPISPSAKSKLLESEPLYQVYRSRTLSHASMKVRRNQSNKQRISAKKKDQASSEQVEDEWRSDLMTDDAGATTLWKEVKEVVESGIGEDLTKEEMKLQQAQFEVVTSQASYMRSLNILIDHFMNDSIMQDTSILPKKQKKELFSNIVDVRKIEQAFLQEIEQHFWSKLYLTEIAKITARYASADFEVYVRYVQNQVYQDRVLTDLQRHNDRFAEELNRLESSPSCNKLPLLSFLLLPMQRVTRLPLLVSAIVNQADAAEDDDAYKEAKDALVVVNKLVKKCNEGARKMQQTEQLAEIAKEMKFASNVKTYALVSQSRSLVKKGEMSATMIVENRKPKTLKLWLFLFTDVLLVAKKKTFLDSVSGAKYEVIDWAKRAMLFVNERAVSENEIFLVLLENCSSKRVELTLTPVSLNELSRWTDALSPHHVGESEDSIYESWDCPQYQCMEPYAALQPDELTLEVGDVMRVLKKTGDGWLEGERLRDSESGWFPADKCFEIEDEHVRARNLKNLYRITPQGSDHFG